MASDADDKLRQGQTVKEALDRCLEIAEERQIEAAKDMKSKGAWREFDLARQAMETAQMRYTRGRAMQLGKFAPADLDA
jgi:hypothetical protein